MKRLAHGTMTREKLAHHSFNLFTKTGFVKIKTEHVLASIEAFQA